MEGGGGGMRGGGGGGEMARGGGEEGRGEIPVFFRMLPPIVEVVPQVLAHYKSQCLHMC